MLAAENGRVVNLDCTIVAQRPKLAPCIPQMQDNIAADLRLDRSRVNVKATTTEGLGFCGREQGIAAYAVVLLELPDGDDHAADEGPAAKPDALKPA